MAQYDGAAQFPEQEEAPEEQDEAQERAAAKKQLKKFIDSKNIAEELDDDCLREMGRVICEWFDEDQDNRKEWLEKNDEWVKLAMQVVERKTYPWPNSSNIKYPLLTIAAMQFAARAYPALVPGPKLITGLVLGKDEDGQKSQAAERVGTHMSYQVLFEMEDWEEDMDKLCLAVSIMGCMFKKTYYDELKKINCSELVYPQDLVIDYYAKSVETAFRKSHIIYRTQNEIQERVRKKIWLDQNLDVQPQTDTDTHETYNKLNMVQEPKVGPSTPHKFIECHTVWDLDDDDYCEPYSITVHYDTKKVVRVVARYDEDSIETIGTGKKEQIAKITPIEYFTKFSFIPNPSGSVYDLGFGLLLGGINEAINTLANQLIDAGTLSNLAAGFLGRGIRVRSGNQRFQPGEWKPVDFTGDDIRKHIFPLPVNQPSDVLFKLLELLDQSGQKVASVAEIFVGKMPGQNTPATTTMASIDQAMKVFTAIHKRLYRALAKEYIKLYRLNCVYMDQDVYFTLNAPQGNLPQKVYQADYDPKNISVKPNADPNIVSAQQKIMKMQTIGELLQLGTINPVEFTKRYLEASEIENIPALINENPPPSPEQQKAQADIQSKQMDMQIKQKEAELDAKITMMEAQIKMITEQMKLQFKAKELEMKHQGHVMDMQVKGAEAQQDLQLGQQEHQQEMQQSTVEHKQTMEQGAAQHKQAMTQTREKEAQARKGAKGAKTK